MARVRRLRQLVSSGNTNGNGRYRPYHRGEESSRIAAWVCFVRRVDVSH